MHVLHSEEIRDSIVVLKWFKKEDIYDWKANQSLMDSERRRTAENLIKFELFFLW